MVVVRDRCARPAVETRQKHSVVIPQTRSPPPSGGPALPPCWDAAAIAGDEPTHCKMYAQSDEFVAHPLICCQNSQVGSFEAPCSRLEAAKISRLVKRTKTQGMTRALTIYKLAQGKTPKRKTGASRCIPGAAPPRTGAEKPSHGSSSSAIPSLKVAGNTHDIARRQKCKIDNPDPDQAPCWDGLREAVFL